MLAEAAKNDEELLECLEMVAPRNFRTFCMM